MTAYGTGVYGAGIYGVGEDDEGLHYREPGTGIGSAPAGADVDIAPDYREPGYLRSDTPELRLEWVDPTGRVTALDDLEGVDELGVDGLFMPPFDLLSEAVPERDGERLRGVRAKPRDVTVPIFVQRRDRRELHGLLRFLAETMNPSNGDGVLRAWTDYGTDLAAARDLVCRYTGGLEVSRAQGSGNYDNDRGLWQVAALMLRAFDPYWRDAEPVTLPFTYDAPRPFFPLLPLALSAGSVNGGTRVDNVGSTLAWPVWTVHGPFSSFTASDLTNDATFTLNVALTDTQSVVIDTRPGAKRVRRNDGLNLYQYLTDGSGLWPLRRGASDLSLSLPGATTSSYVNLTYALRYLTP